MIIHKPNCNEACVDGSHMLLSGEELGSDETLRLENGLTPDQDEAFDKLAHAIVDHETTSRGDHRSGNVYELLNLEKGLDALAKEHNLLPPPAHTIKGERFNGGETRFVCTCGVKSKPARGKVTARRINRHTFKTGHQWEPSS